MSKQVEESVVEFAVNMASETEIDEVLSKQEGISSVSINRAKQSVVITSVLPIAKLQELLESTGKRAVILGLGSKSSHSEAAVAMLGGVVGAGTVQGVVRFVQVNPEICVIDGVIDGLSPGDHALAIHECGDISQGCLSVGGHYNPHSTRHGSPTDEDRHVGDLGNVNANAEGRTTFKIYDHLVKVHDIVGRSIAIAEKEDDFGRGNSQLSMINGNCGSLLSCGIIARASGLFENSKRICACDGVSLWDERDKPLAGTGRSNKIK